MANIKPLLRRLPRCHPASWLAVFLVAVAMILIMVPGERLDVSSVPEDVATSWWSQLVQETRSEAQRLYQLPPPEHDGSQFFLLDPSSALSQHGWPAPAFVRATPIDLSLSFFNPIPSAPPKPAWADSDNWPLRADIWRMHWGNLLLDIAVFVLIVVGTGVLIEVWLRRRGGLFRFQLIDVLAALTAACLLLGWWQWHARIAQEEVRVHALLNRDSPKKATSIKRFYDRKEYFGPDWLKRLVGHADYLPFLNHTDEAHLIYVDHTEDSFKALCHLPYLKLLSVQGPAIPVSVIKELRQATRLENLSYLMNSPLEAPVSGSLLRRWLDADAAPELIGPSELDQLAELELKELGLAGYLLIAEDIERALRGNPHLKLLELRDVSITVEEFEELKRRYPDTTIAWTPAEDQRPESAEVDEAHRQAYESRQKSLRELKAARGYPAKNPQEDKP